LHVFEGTYDEFVGERETEVRQLALEQATATQPIELDWVEEIAPPPTKKERKQKGKQKRDLVAELEEAEFLLEQILFDLETAESRQDEASLPQLHDELKVIQARLDDLTAELDDWGS
jgi:hypothetical protein